MRQTTTHEFHFDKEVCNVMYFDHDGSLYVNDTEDNAVQIHGINPEDLLMLVRNLFATGDITADTIKKPYQKNQIEEIQTAVNRILEQLDA